MAINDKERFKYRRKQFQALMQKYSSNSQLYILDQIKQEWQLMINSNSPNLPLVNNAGVKDQFPEFTIKVKGKNGECNNEDKKLSIIKAERKCKGCGKDISYQSPQSIFCSEKYVGEKQAHRCRNMDSNMRNNFIGKINRLEAKGLLFDIMPFFTKNILENNTRTRSA